jgi:hypothetical protein
MVSIQGHPHQREGRSNNFGRKGGAPMVPHITSTANSRPATRHTMQMRSPSPTRAAPVLAQAQAQPQPAPSHEEDDHEQRAAGGAPHDPDEDDAPSVVVAMVWKAQTLGLAFVQGAELRFCEVADAAPEFRMLQLAKHALRPDVIVAPVRAPTARARATTTTQRTVTRP